MKPNAFIGHTKQPTDAELTAALGAARPLWDEVAVAMARDLGIPGREWKSYGAKHGWSLRLQKAKRNIVHLAPQAGSFVVFFILGDRALKAARAGRLSRAAAKLLDEAPHYPEGTGIRFEGVRKSDLPFIRTLAKIKLEV